jgi:hypothetical protein
MRVQMSAGTKSSATRCDVLAGADVRRDKVLGRDFSATPLLRCADGWIKVESPGPRLDFVPAVRLCRSPPQRGAVSSIRFAAGQSPGGAERCLFL